MQKERNEGKQHKRKKGDRNKYMTQGRKQERKKERTKYRNKSMKKKERKTERT